MESGRRREVLSLKKACLEFISSNLSTYNEAFCTTEDADLKSNLEYLRRFHSSYFIKENFDHQEELMDESYFYFLINEYLEELDLSVFDPDYWDALLRRMAEVGHAFKVVGFYIPDEWESLVVYEDFTHSKDEVINFVHGVMNFVHEVIRNIPNVEKLNFEGNCKDTTLEIIASSCPKLKELVINGSDITYEGLKSLCRHMRSGTEEESPRLRVLSLQCMHNLNDGVEFLLRNMPSLETIEYTGLNDVLYCMHKDDKNILQRKYNLLSLHFGDDYLDNLTDMLCVISEVCPRVSRLSLPNANAECLYLLTRLSELKDLKITGDNSHADCSSFIKCRGRGLRKLKLHELQISADILIQSCPNLEILRLWNMTFRPLGYGFILTYLYRLRKLTLYDLNFEEALTQQSVAAVLKSSPILRELRFSFCKFENPRRNITDLMKSCSSRSLMRLEFAACNIDDATLRTALSTCLDLESISLFAI